jgi:archaellum biogenesis ATPase FlaH
MPPTVVIDSGNGYHAYWALERPYEVPPHDVSMYEGVLKGLAHALGADPACAELARILRLPNSTNFKDKSNPKPVNVVTLEPDRRYSVSDFAKFVIPAPGVACVDPSREPVAIDSLTAQLQAMSAEAHNRYPTMLRVAGSLLGRGLTAEDAYQFILPHAQRVGSVAALEKIIKGLSAKEQAKRDAEGLGDYTYGEEAQLDVSSDRKQDFLQQGTARPALPHPYEIGEGRTAAEEGMKLMTFSELLSNSSQAIDWRVVGLFPSQGVCIVAGEGGVGKSWLSMDLALSVSRGEPWMGHYPTKPCTVLYVDLENSKNLMSLRFNKLAKAQGLAPTDVTNIHLHKSDTLPMDTRAGYEALCQAIEQTGARLVVLDSLTRIHSGDENTVKDMARLSRALLSVASKYEACIVVLDHLGKAGNGLRGSTEKRAVAETIIEAEEFDAVNTVMQLKVTKLRATGDKPKPFLVELEDISPNETVVRLVGENEDGDLGRDYDLEWVLELTERRGGKIPRPELVREAKKVKGWGEKKVGNILYRGRTLNKLKVSAEANPETKRLQNVVELVRELKTGEQVAMTFPEPTPAPDDSVASYPWNKEGFSFFDEEPAMT